MINVILTTQNGDYYCEYECQVLEILDLVECSFEVNSRRSLRLHHFPSGVLVTKYIWQQESKSYIAVRAH